MRKTEPHDHPLSARVEDGQLHIRVGLNTLKWMAEHSPNGALVWRDEESEDLEFLTHTIEDPEGFAEDVIVEMDREDEDGTTALHLFLEEMMIGAIEQGSDSVSEKPQRADDLPRS